MQLKGGVEDKLDNDILTRLHFFYDISKPVSKIHIKN